MTEAMIQVITEIAVTANETKFTGYSEFLDLFNRDDSAIICAGAGRVGLAMRSFAMRLSHLGIEAHYLGDTTVPHTGPGDFLLVGSGSGSTASILRIVEIAKYKGLKIGLVTATPLSPMKTIADTTVLIEGPGLLSKESKINSIQPMTTLFEQILSLFLDATVLDLMKKFDETSESMWARHNVIE
jgi:6-phospho-3-hexuloisomerase